MKIQNNSMYSETIITNIYWVLAKKKETKIGNKILCLIKRVGLWLNNYYIEKNKN